MIQRLVATALRMRAIVFSMVVVVIIAGLAAYHRLDIEAYPNPCPPLVEIIVQPVGWSAEEVERYVTIPMEVGIAGMKGLDHVRSQSLFELADIKCYFKWGFDYWAVRQEVINRLQFIQLPTGLTGSLSPWNAIGEVYRYTLTGKGYTVRDLKTAEDWIMERQWRQVDGVIDVTSFGGETKEYHVEVDPFRLRGQGVTLSQVTTAIGNANQNVGGGRVVIGSRPIPGAVEFYVQDFGAGIASEHLTRIFERFYRVDKARSRESGGTGLGLSIAKHIILAHGGTIRAESELNRGSTFFFTLPADPSTQLTEEREENIAAN